MSVNIEISLILMQMNFKEKGECHVIHTRSKNIFKSS